MNITGAKKTTRRLFAWILSFVLVFSCVVLPFPISAEEDAGTEAPAYHKVTFISKNSSVTFSINESLLATPADYAPEASPSNATVSDATTSDATVSDATVSDATGKATVSNASASDADTALQDGMVTNNLSTAVPASPSDTVLYGLQEATVFVRDMESLTEDQIPGIKSSSKYIGVNGWKDEAGYFFSDSGLLFTGISRDMVFTANTFSTRLMRLAASGYVCKIGNTGYTSLLNAVTAAASGATIEMLVENYTLSAYVNLQKNLTITKAAENAATLPYEGTPGSIPTIKKAGTGDYGLLHASSSAVVNINNLCLNGQNYATTGGSHAGLLYVDGSANVTLGTNAEIKNAYGGQAAAIYVNAATLSMTGNSSVHDSTGTNSGVIDLSNGAVINIRDNATIYNNTGIGTSSAIFLRNVSSTKSTLNIYGNARIYGNTATVPATIEGCAITCHHDAGTINISGNAAITGNNSSASTLLIPTGCTLNMSGGYVTGNTASGTTTAYSGGINASSGSTINLSGTAVIKDNTNSIHTSQKNLYLATNALLKVTGAMDKTASVGVYCPNNMNLGNQFGNTSAASAKTVKGLYTFFADTNSTQYGDAAASGSGIIWKNATCQIIRGGAVQGLYTTLSEACAAAANGDIIEVFKSHTVTAQSLLSGKTGITIRTAPVTTPTVTGAYLFMPGSGETTTATVKRDATLTSSAMLSFGNGSAITTGNIIFDGNSGGTAFKASTSLLAVPGSGSSITLGSKTVVQNSNVTTADDTVVGTIHVNTGNTLTLNDVIFTGNFASKGGAVYSDANATVNITNSNFSGNSGGMGGSIYLNKGSSATISTSSFTNNSAVLVAGAIVSMTGNLTIDHSTFTGNSQTSTSYFCGAIYSSGTLMLSNSSFDGNTSKSVGGAIFSTGSISMTGGNSFTANRGTKGSAIYATKLSMSGTNSITGNTSTLTFAGMGGAVFITSPDEGKLTVSGKQTITGNTTSDGGKSNVVLQPSGMIKAQGALDAGSSIGVTVALADHIAAHKFVHSFTADGVSADFATAASNKAMFSDDYSPQLNIGANSTDATGNTDFNTYIYFIPPTRLQFLKKSDSDVHPALPGATFHIYKWIGSGSIPTAYLTDAQLTADTANWSRLTYTNQDNTPNTTQGNTFTSAADGTVDCGFLEDRTYRLIEVTAPTGYILPTGEWNVSVLSSAAPQFTFSTIKNGSPDTTTYDFQTDQTKAVPYSVYNYCNVCTLTVNYKNLWEAYSDRLKKGNFTITYTGEDNVLHTVTAQLDRDTKTDINAIKAGTTVTVTQTDTAGYTVTYTAEKPDTETITQASGNTVWTYSAVRGHTNLTITNDKTAIVPTGVNTGEGNGTAGLILLSFLILAALAFLTGAERKHRQS